ncbi:hypothetical protein C8F04DRAFT_422656 [Mycena alexandri]|uniref:DUF6534 domain-containing protein n=1 Tax=Mycena alexandri TaxID=1745969 RepID=A0AAD6WR19_9AGAR|nr:hypothetical protein C8F04DRAFT_422656 [Mycena alexandri]
MVSLDKAVGSLLLGTFLNSYLLVIELFQLSYYFRHMKNDGWIMQRVVGFAGVINAVDSLAEYTAVYLYGVTYWGNEHYLTIQNWPIAFHFVATGVVGALVQGFMLYRFWRMTQHSITVVILSLFSATAFGGSIGTAVRTSVNIYFSQRGDATLFVTIWLIAGMIADVGIAVSLVWRLHRVKATDQPAKSLLRRLITSAISTGSSTSLIAVVAVFAYFHEPASNVAISVTFILGRVYSCTMLYLLNNRSKMRGEMADGTMEVGLATTFNLGGIYINRIAVVTRHLADDPAASAHAVPEIERKDEPFSGLVDVNDPDALRLSISTWTTVSSCSRRSSTSSEGASSTVVSEHDSHVSIQDDTPSESIP